MNIEANEKSERYFVHVSARIYAEKFKEFFLCGIVHEDKPVEELESIVGEDEDQEIVVDQLDHGTPPTGEQFEEARHPSGCVFILVFVDIVVPSYILFVKWHLENIF